MRIFLIKILWAVALAISVLPGWAVAATAGTSSDPGASPGGVQAHWAFRRPELSAVPAVKNRRWVRNPIDAFILARLEAEGLTPSPEADRRTLIRRLSLDLTGLPPTPEEVNRFLSDREPRAYERLVDSLLESPHFGERWARHWLDLARFAESSGYQVDKARPYAHRFRDWVIEAMNTDLAYDQFTLQQIAGDLLPQPDFGTLRAAGFHRMTLMNYEDGINVEEFHSKAKVDRVSTTGTVWLGLTLGCAECHDHKHDPISQREFYQLYAFFNQANEADLSARTLPEARSSESNRAPAGPVPKSKVHGDVMTFQESAKARPVHIHIRGDRARQGEEVRVGTPAVLHAFKARGAKPDRLDLAQWLVDPANPLTARVAVNQIWQHLLGRGLVETPGDFGTHGQPPSHPALLDWLAVAFVNPGAVCLPQEQAADRAWSRKALIRRIVNSATYRQSSRIRPALQERDPQNIQLSRQNRFRVEAEIVRDIHLAAGGLLNRQVGGPSFYPYMPEDVKMFGEAGGFQWFDSAGPEKYRRGLYIFAQRTVPYPVSMTFDQADPTQSCPQREISDTPLQALTLLNYGIFAESTQALARRILSGPGRSRRDRIEHGFELCLARKPARPELERLERLYEDQLALVRTLPDSVARLGRGAAPADQPTPEAAAWVAVSEVLLNLDECITRD